MSAVATKKLAATSRERVGPPRFVMIGGFLGAGKTTLASRLGEHLKATGKTAAFVTNAEGSDVVDRTVLEGAGFKTENIAGGSIGNQFEAFSKASARLLEAVEPDVFVVEPVGSSADLVGTISEPVREGKQFDFAPFTVVLDAVRAAGFFKVDGEPGFSERVQYLYRKQMEEADLVLINKTDLISPSVLAALRERLAAEFAGARILDCSAKTGVNLEAWFDAVLRGTAPIGRRVGVDVNRTGESLLGSLNCALQVSALKGFEVNPILRELALAIAQELQTMGTQIGHLKMAFLPEVDVGGVGRVSVVGNGGIPDLGSEFPEPIERGNLRLNLRAEGDPDRFHAAVTNALNRVWMLFPDVFARLTQMEHFRPGLRDFGQAA